MKGCKFGNNCNFIHEGNEKKVEKNTEKKDIIKDVQNLLENIDTKFVDTHVHLEYIMEKTKITEFNELEKKFFPIDNFDGCICIFSDL